MTERFRSRSRRALDAALTALAVLAALALLGPGHAQAKTVTVPFELMKTRHMAVQVRLNGQGPFRLVFDTGSPITFFSNEAATKAGLVTPEVAARPALLGLRGQMTARSVALGEAEATDLPVMVLDHPTLTQIAAVDGPIHGIVGLTFFGRYRTSIDYQKREMTFTPVNYRPKEVTSGLAATLLNPQAAGPRVVGGTVLLGLRVEKADMEPGVRIAEVLAGSAAERAGLRPGDRLLTVDGRWTDSVAECFDAATLVKPGRAAALRYVRGGETRVAELRPRVGL